MRSHPNRHRVLVYGLLSLLAVSMLFPFYWMAITSLKQKADVFSTQPKFFPGKRLAEQIVEDPRWFFRSRAANYSEVLTWRRQASS